VNLGPVTHALVIVLLSATRIFSQSSTEIFKNDIPPLFVQDKQRARMINDVLERLVVNSPESLPYYMTYLNFTLDGSLKDSALIYFQHSKLLEFQAVEEQNQWSKRQRDMIQEMESNRLISRSARWFFKQLKPPNNFDLEAYIPPVQVAKNKQDYFRLKTISRDADLSYHPGNNYSILLATYEKSLVQVINTTLSSAKNMCGLNRELYTVTRDRTWPLFQKYPELLDGQPAEIVLQVIRRGLVRVDQKRNSLGLSWIPVFDGADFEIVLKHEEGEIFELETSQSMPISLQGKQISLKRRFFRGDYTTPFSHIDLSLGVTSYDVTEWIGLPPMLEEVGNVTLPYWEKITTDSNYVKIQSAVSYQVGIALPLVIWRDRFSVSLGGAFQLRQIDYLHGYTPHWDLITYHMEGSIRIREYESWDGEPEEREGRELAFTVKPYLEFEMGMPMRFLTLSGRITPEYSAFGLNIRF